MSLTVRRIAFDDFRNYRSFELDGLGPLTILVGPNAVGKTNVVEGIQLLTALSSFRHPTAEQLVRVGAPAARLATDVTDGSRALEITLRVEEGAKRYALNGKPKRSPDLKGLVPSVAFTPDDLDLVKGAMSIRRAAMDSLGSQLSANHGVIKRDYERVVRYKNRLLKEEASDDLVESINETLVTCGAQLVCYRAALFEKLAPALRARYDGLASRGESLRAFYVPSWEPFDVQDPRCGPIARDEARVALADALAARRHEERQRRRALVGPHADRVEFLIDGADASLFGSQGQQRSIVLAFKLAEAAVIEEVLHQKPVLLLDDVMSELDAMRRAALMDYMATDVQTFITTTNLAYFEDEVLDRARIVALPLDASSAPASGHPGCGPRL